MKAFKKINCIFVVRNYRIQTRKRMKKSLIIILSIFFSLSISAQTIQGSEIGIDGSVGFSSMGGSFGIGLKYGYKKSPDFIWGPSFRLMRYWSSSYNLDYTGHSNIWGGGVYAHYRIQNVLPPATNEFLIQHTSGKDDNFTRINPTLCFSELHAIKIK